MGNKYSFSNREDIILNTFYYVYDNANNSDNSDKIYCTNRLFHIRKISFTYTFDKGFYKKYNYNDIITMMMQQIKMVTTEYNRHLELGSKRIDERYIINYIASLFMGHRFMTIHKVEIYDEQGCCFVANLNDAKKIFKEQKRESFKRMGFNAFVHG